MITCHAVQVWKSFSWKFAKEFKDFFLMRRSMKQNIYVFTILSLPRHRCRQQAYGWMKANSVWEFENFLLTSSWADNVWEKSFCCCYALTYNSGSKNCAKAAQSKPFFHIFARSQTFMHNKILLCAERALNRFQWSLLFHKRDECLKFRGLINCSMWFYSLSRMFIVLENIEIERKLKLWGVEDLSSLKTYHLKIVAIIA